ncbi:hypothetical protein EI42_05852 [Thermosporothrix hazakensis]|jgi:hypothetical protein|uniref:Uncharacterized protein n=1 Tax=Thermosporothrix hazakensis TaxID=644383 RepID=A0A326U541_THEHA|nr:hypothetical protein [Thermosporothrix hazakensis]PZW20777.1 hypothetical protein EI42_05852 [Thermosporothrix hazakensis]GCE50455.1 hypothetical protein KTH_53240 [Thermosporothrix hazakensis]
MHFISNEEDYLLASERQEEQVRKEQKVMEEMQETVKRNTGLLALKVARHLQASIATTAQSLMLWKKASFWLLRPSDTRLRRTFIPFYAMDWPYYHALLLVIAVLEK